jgi:hypothetical protein
MRGDLESLARSRFSDLTTAELKLLRDSPKGQVTLCGPNDPNDPANDPSNSDKWSKDREIRANLIRWLYVNRHASELVDPSGIQVQGAKIVGEFNLSFVNSSLPLGLYLCRLMQNAELVSMEIPELNLAGSWVRSINADAARIRGGFFLRNGFRAEGEVRLSGAQIGQLSCVNGKFINPLRTGVANSGNALTAEGVQVTSSVVLTDGFYAEGRVRLTGSQIGANLECTKGTFLSQGDALIAVRSAVKGAVLLYNGFRTNGTVNLDGAQIQGDLECQGAEISLLQVNWAQIGGIFNCAGSRFDGVWADDTSVKGIFAWSSIKDAQQTKLNLVNTSLGALVDDAASWPAPGNLGLDGLVYGRISGGPRDAASRLDWLARQKEYSLQPYQQLAKVLKDAGDERGAKQVLVEMERRQGVEWSAKPVRLLWSTVGYGYYPSRAFWGLVASSAFGWYIYRRARVAGTMTPTEKDAYEGYKQNGRVPPHYTRFSPFVYSVETVFPLVKLGQASTWQPDPNIVSSPKFKKWSAGFVRWIRGGNWRTRFKVWTLSPPFLRGITLILVLVGWLLATLFLVGVTGLIRKD